MSDIGNISSFADKPVIPQGVLDLSVFDSFNDSAAIEAESTLHEEENIELNFKKIRARVKQAIPGALQVYRGVFQLVFLSRPWKNKYYKLHEDFLKLKDDKQFCEAVCDWVEENEAIAFFIECLPSYAYILFGLVAATAANIVEVDEEENKNITKKLSDQADNAAGNPVKRSISEVNNVYETEEKRTVPIAAPVVAGSVNF